MDEPSNTEFETCLSQSKEMQQEYYELLPDWIIYEKKDYELLKMNVGYALFGSPRSDSEEDDKNKMYTFDEKLEIHFSKEAINAMKVILKRIYDYGTMTDGSIYCGVIYNITFDKTEHNIYPIFKIKNNSKAPLYKFKDSQTVSSNNVWYIDHNGRIYKNWNDYKNSNTLPPCVMVIPKDGKYQADPTSSITEISSTVWLEIIPSSACSLNSQICNKMDKASSALALGSAGISLVSLAIPVTAPIAIAGLASTAISSFWCAGRSICELNDRYSHEESIRPTNRTAFRAWLGIAGSTMGLLASSGTMLLSKSVRSGANIGRSARVIYNTTVIGNISVNFVGLGYNGYSLWEKYKTQEHIDASDAFYFFTHVLFFGSAVINVQFASEIIADTQGQIMKDYEATLRSKRHRKAYNRVKRNASETSEIVRHIKKVTSRRELLSFNDKTNKPNNNTSTNISVKFTNAKLMLGKVTLFDPVVFARACSNDGDFASSLFKSTIVIMYDNLRVILSNYLNECSKDYPLLKNISLIDFHSFLSEVQHIKDGEQALKLILDIVIKIIGKSNTLTPFIVKIVNFVWKYAVSHLKGKETGSHDTDSMFLMDIILTIRDNIDKLMDSFLRALYNLFNKQKMLY